MAHIGVLRELEDAGIVVDRIAGTSLGADRRGDLCARARRRTVQEIHHEGFVRGNPFGDYTIPSKALTKGRRTPERTASLPRATTPGSRRSRGCSGACRST